MQRNFKEASEAKMKLLGVTAEEVGEMLGVDKTRVSKALGGGTRPSEASVRLRVAAAITGMVDKRRRELEDELEAAREDQFPELKGRLSVIMPEDLIYIVTEDGMPVGVWLPEAKVFRELDDVILPVIRVKK